MQEFIALLCKQTFTLWFQFTVMYNCWNSEPLWQIKILPFLLLQLNSRTQVCEIRMNKAEIYLVYMCQMQSIQKHK